MSKLQDVHTTVEQSQQLLELGVPAWTAEGKFYNCSHDTRCTIWARDLNHSPKYEGELPCWSYGRLIEIYNLCAHGFYTLTKVPKDLIEHILSRYDWEVRHVGMNFEKLEE